MSTNDAAPVTRTYGNWRKARGIGIGKLDGIQTAVLFVAIVLPLLSSYFSLTASLITGAFSLLVLLTLVVPFDNMTLAMIMSRRIKFIRGKQKGWTELSSGILTDHPRGKDLPGAMAPIVPLDTDDGRGGRQCLLWDRRAGLISAVIRVAPVGLDLADNSQADAWVAAWGGWLADLGYQPLVRYISVTVDSAPTGGATVRDYVNSRIDPSSPMAAQQVLAQLVEATPTASADVDTRVTITFDPNRANPRPKNLLHMVAEITRWLPGIERSLAASGAAVLSRASTEWIISRLRLAYDPASRSIMSLAGESVLHDWEDAAPVSAKEAWTHWTHDTGTSVSWALKEAPRQAVISKVLSPLLSPGRYARRVTLTYTPYSAEAAAAIVEREINNLQVRQAWARRTKRDETQRDRDDFARAITAAREEAEGAGVGNFCLYVTTTVDDEAHLPAAIADVEQRGGQAKLRMRRLNGAQATGFAAALGFGVNPVELAKRAGR